MSMQFPMHKSCRQDMKGAARSSLLVISSAVCRFMKCRTKKSNVSFKLTITSSKVLISAAGMDALKLMDAPKMNINIYENQDPAGTYGAKSIVEPATEGVGAAIANAIFNATGRRVYENPADLETVLLGHKLQ